MWAYLEDDLKSKAFVDELLILEALQHGDYKVSSQCVPFLLASCTPTTLCMSFLAAKRSARECEDR